MTSLTACYQTWTLGEGEAMNKFCIVIDTETTGFVTDAQAKVVSLGAVAYDLGPMQEVGHFYRVVKPSVYAKSFRHTV